ncbi:hypothetical protein NDU88_004367 [Pleurodeles waltl]|uniref:Uncharacterized protein n=1 Tax=Pleurodeles waltl TaxID=8319 RepID=A0AAV7TRN5_PLEWA|nr:hypothetical protein NDU88_004367 [Pleurodeles waltl]
MTVELLGHTPSDEARPGVALGRGPAPPLRAEVLGGCAELRRARADWIGGRLGLGALSRGVRLVGPPSPERSGDRGPHPA